MHTILNQVLTVNELALVRAILSAADFVDGRATSALAAKRNLQLPIDSAASLDAGTIVLNALARNDTFNIAVQPLALHQPLFSRYDFGMSYPDHIDAALMGRIRTDVAITLFLSDLQSYDGGELVVDTGWGLREYRLPAGDAVAYPANTVHHIAPVSSGTRLVCVLWAQSVVRHPAHREILYDLAALVRSLGDTACGPRIQRSYWNLLRMWAETSPAGWCPAPDVVSSPPRERLEASGDDLVSDKRE